MFRGRVDQRWPDTADVEAADARTGLDERDVVPRRRVAQVGEREVEDLEQPLACRVVAGGECGGERERDVGCAAEDGR